MSYWRQRYKKSEIVFFLLQLLQLSHRRYYIRIEKSWSPPVFYSPVMFKFLLQKWKKVYKNKCFKINVRCCQPATARGLPVLGCPLRNFNWNFAGSFFREMKFSLDLVVVREHFLFSVSITTTKCNYHRRYI